jgi:hypothetical protein
VRGVSLLFGGKFVVGSMNLACNLTAALEDVTSEKIRNSWEVGL